MPLVTWLGAPGSINVRYQPLVPVPYPKGSEQATATPVPTSENGATHRWLDGEWYHNKREPGANMTPSPSFWIPVKCIKDYAELKRSH